MFKKGIFTALTLFTLVFSGCSDLNDGEAKGREVVDRKLSEANCDIDAENFEYLFSKPISADIECAYKKVNLLIDLVKKDLPELKHKNISRTTLTNFIKKKSPDTLGIIEYLDIFFTLNTFVVGSQTDHIIANDFRVLRDFLIVMNREFSKVFKYFSRPSRTDEIIYNLHLNSTNQILSTLRYIMLEAKTTTGEDISLKGLFSRHKNVPRSINLSRLMELFKSPDGSKTWLFLKKLFIGGDASVLTNSEFLDFIYSESKDKQGKIVVENKVLKAVEIGYNLYRQSFLKFDSPQKRFVFQKRNFEVAFDMVYKKSKKEALFTVDDLAKWLTHYFKDQLVFNKKRVDLMKYNWELRRIKEIFIGNNSNNITSEDIEKFVGLLIEISNVGDDFSRLFSINQSTMLDETIRIDSETNLENVSNLNVETNFDLFKYVLKTFRYLKGNKRMPVYSSYYHRDNQSIISLGQLEFILRKMARFYESKYPCNIQQSYKVYNYQIGGGEEKKFFHDYYCNSGHHPSVEDNKGNFEIGQLYFAILEFRQLFHDVGIVDPGEEDKAAENAFTVPDLFIYAANDDGQIQVSELLEFFYNVMNATKIKDDVMNQLKADEMNSLSGSYVYSQINCPIVDIKGGEPRYEANCIRDNFYKFLQQETRFQDMHFQYLPNLFNFYSIRRNSAERAALKRYTLLLEAYTKSCPYDNIPYTESDIMGIYTGMYSIESTIGKFDRDGDNIINQDESEDAYKHFFFGLESIVLDELKGEAGIKSTEPEKVRTGIRKYIHDVVSEVKEDVENFTTEEIVKLVFKYLLRYQKLPLPISSNIKTIIGAGIQGFPEASRETIAHILVILQELTEPKRKVRYERAGLKYITKEVRCKKLLPIGQDTLVRKEWKCLFNKDCI